MNTDPAHSTLEQEAATWFARLRGERVSAEDRARFAAWLNQSPDHRRAYEEIAAFWNHPNLREVLATTPLSRPVSRRPGWRVGLVLAAGLALLAVIYRPVVLNCLDADICTTIGETRVSTLADGSRVLLNTDSALRVRYGPRERRVELARGEAYFEVQPNPQQPFVVVGAHSETRVKGTRFTVRIGAERDSVTVIGGVVEVSGAGRTAPLLRQNDHVGVDASGPGRVDTVQATLTTAWIKGNAVFDNAPLTEVIAELGRYRRGAVIFAKPALKSLRVGGHFDLGDTDRALDSLEQTLPIRVHRIGAWLVIIS